MRRRMDIIVVILDTAGRLHIDEDMMEELEEDQGSRGSASDDSSLWMP